MPWQIALQHVGVPGNRSGATGRTRGHDQKRCDSWHRFDQ